MYVRRRYMWHHAPHLPHMPHLPPHHFPHMPHMPHIPTPHIHAPHLHTRPGHSSQSARSTASGDAGSRPGSHAESRPGSQPSSPEGGLGFVSPVKVHVQPSLSGHGLLARRNKGEALALEIPSKSKDK